MALLSSRTWVQALMAAIILGFMLSATVIRFLRGTWDKAMKPSALQQ